MSAISEGPLTSLAFCWAVERRDGAGCALTSASHAIEHDGVRFDAAPGMMPAAIVRTGTLEAGSGEVAGAVTSAALAGDDLAAGRWDGAAVTLSAVDWSDPGAARMVLARGEIGEVAVRGGDVLGRAQGGMREARCAGVPADLADVPGELWRCAVPRRPGRAVGAGGGPGGRGRGGDARPGSRGAVLVRAAALAERGELRTVDGYLGL